ncbi:LysR family transcriptional regulator [Anaerovorax odorimutans]|uniref:LysR family transcriptional regulator n=1 Tax=Anaerovorax odorimutans TaxID=109327 RepID=UPI00040BDC1D|nr:LysR family transcriptional regulator [Anaerovorax odorimutans]
MTLRHFKIFVAVCDKMNMTSAAKSLFMSQSAVSQAIAELEKYYGVRLFERLSKKLYLTQAGEKLLSYACHIISIHTEIESDMKLLHKNSFVRIGASVTIGTYILPKLISTFKEKNNQSHIEVFENNTQIIESMILHDQIDMGIVEGELTSSDIISKPLMDDELVLICGKAHSFAKRSIIEPTALEKEEFIIREKGSGTRKTFEDIMTANQIKWKGTWTCNNADTIKMAVIENLGISVISRLAVLNEIRAGLLYEIPIKNIQFKRQFKIIYHKNKYLTETINELIELCMRKYS